MMRLLVLDQSSGRYLFALIRAGQPVYEHSGRRGPGQAETFARRLAEIMKDARIDAVAAIVGPGSFTGVRAALALAHGVALARDVPVIGVTVPEAVRAGQAGTDPAAIWVVQSARSEMMVLDHGNGPILRREDDWPPMRTPVTLFGDRAEALLPRLAALGQSARLGRPVLPDAQMIAAAAMQRAGGLLPPLPAVPLYLEAAATTPGAVRRPAPLPSCP